MRCWGTAGDSFLLLTYTVGVSSTNEGWVLCETLSSNSFRITTASALNVRDANAAQKEKDPGHTHTQRRGPFGVRSMCGSARISLQAPEKRGRGKRQAISAKEVAKAVWRHARARANVRVATCASMCEHRHIFTEVLQRSATGRPPILLNR